MAAFENDQYGDLHAVIAIQHGIVKVEQYFNGSDPSTLVDVRSAGKSVTSLLVGIAVDQGAIASLDDRVEKYWTEAKGSAVGGVRLKDVLTMRTGLDADSNNPESAGIEDKMDASDDPIAFALSIPSVEAPGSQYRYNSLAAYIAGIVVERSSGIALEEFARIHLFDPLELDRWEWQKDRSGQTKGQGNMFLTATGAARIGEMVLNDGRFGEKQLISAGWIDKSLTTHVDVSAIEPNAIGYGYYWYYQKQPYQNRTTDMYFASGSGGNKIYLIPELDLVVAVLSRAYRQGRGHRRSEEILATILATIP